MIQDLLPNQVVCNNKNEKGKPCHGGLKRYHPFAGYFNETDEHVRQEIRQTYGGEDPHLVLLKCEKCSLIYRLPEILRKKFKQKA